MIEHANTIRSGAMVALAGLIGATSALQVVSILLPRVQEVARVAGRLQQLAGG